MSICIYMCVCVFVSLASVSELGLRWLFNKLFGISNNLEPEVVSFSTSGDSIEQWLSV